MVYNSYIESKGVTGLEGTDRQQLQQMQGIFL
jgi:hypothetical protein